MKKLIFLLSFCYLFGIEDSFATHSMGGEIFVTHVSGSQYKLNVRFWRFSSGAIAPSTFDVITRSIASSSNFYFHSILSLDSSKVISPNYAEEYYYSSLITFPFLNERYRIITSTCCRNLNILNLGGIGSSAHHFAVTTEFSPSAVGSSNSSPRFLLPPEPFAPVNQPYIHGPFAFDPDGDSLTFRLEVSQTMGYMYGYLINIPTFIPIYQVNNTPYSFDAQTGTFFWLPNTLGSHQLTYAVDEWRNGTKIGSVMRDIQISVINNSVNTNPPTILLNGNPLTGFTLPSIQIQAGSPFTLNLDITDPDPTTKSFLFTGPVFQGPSAAVASTTTTSTGISAVINWTPSLSMISPVPHQMHIKYREVTPLYTFSRDIPVMLQVSSIVAGLEQSQVDDIAFDAYLNEAGLLQMSLRLPSAKDINIMAYDVQGRKLAKFAEGTMTKGQHQFISDKLTAHQGLIILKAVDGKGWQKTLKLIKP